MCSGKKLKDSHSPPLVAHSDTSSILKLLHVTCQYLSQYVVNKKKIESGVRVVLGSALFTGHCDIEGGNACNYYENS
jgi:hypothetical protein